MTTRRIDWKAIIWSAVLAFALLLMIRTDVTHLNWVTDLSLQGSPPPERDANSATGYALGQRHFLGAHERGLTYRWIDATQTALHSGFFANPTYEKDTVPLGRPQMLPKLYTAWLAAISWSLHLVTGEPLAISVELAALWEPVVSHALAFIAAALFMWRRFGPAAAGAVGLFFALFPPLAAQFIPGTLAAERWALLLAAYAIALSFPAIRGERFAQSFSIRSAIASSLSLWLDPVFGFPAVVITAVVGAAGIAKGKTPFPCLKWALIGTSLTVAAWVIDQSPWAPEASELRFVHPLYALAWLGLGLGLHGWQSLRTQGSPRKRAIAAIALAAPLLGALAYVQISKGYLAWLYPSASMLRIASLDESTVYKTAADWLAAASAVEIILLILPALASVAALALSIRSRWKSKVEDSPNHLPSLAALMCVLALAFFLIRWSVIASLISGPLIWAVASRAPKAFRLASSGLGAAFLFGLFAWGFSLPPSLARPSAERGARPADVEALLFRHFSHWIASHSPDRDVAALAPPALSDSLIFHGGSRALMSTAWQSYLGHVAASRVLSAPESTEAEAVLESHGVTHLALPSWDQVLPLLVRSPEGEQREPLYELLQRWVYPPYLRPVPYKMPPMPAFAGEKLAVFMLTDRQDGALSLSRLAEYFVEMEREEPATLVADVLAESYSDDPNAAIARATVYAMTRDIPAFRQQVSKLVADTNSGLTPRRWDRRVLRAILLAFGKQHPIAKPEIKECLASMTEDALYQLTPLQTLQLIRITEGYGFQFPSEALEALARARCSEYAPK